MNAPVDQPALHRITLVLGGTRSGKSTYAERLILGAARQGSYIATAEAGDAEMSARIAHHRARRGAFWSTVEEPLRLTETLTRLADPQQPILVDCLTLWLANLMGASRDLDRETERLLETLQGFDGKVVFVSNEVGLGIVPDNAMARRFRDAAGLLNQAVAAAADRVVFVAAGLPLIMK